MDSSLSIVGYARVSTEEQAYERALQMQAERLLDAGAHKVLADIGSRSNDERSALKEIIRLALEGLIKKVVVTRLDRITSSPALFEQLTQIFQKQGVALLALDEQVDVHSVDGEFVAGLQIHFAKREVGTIRLRIKKSYEHRRKKALPNPRVPWGYRVEQGKYKLDHSPFLCLVTDKPADDNDVFLGRTKAQLGRDIIDLFLQVQSLNQTIKALHQKYGIYKFKSFKESQELLVFDSNNLDFNKRNREVRAGVFRWSKNGIKLYVMNEVLQGHTRYGLKDLLDSKQKRRSPEDWRIILNTHPTERLIQDEEVVLIKQFLAKNKQLRGFGSPARRNILTGLLFCSECHSTLKCQGVRKSRNVIYYQCQNYTQSACVARKMITKEAIVNEIIYSLIERADALSDMAQHNVPLESDELRQLKSQLLGLEQLGYNQALEAAKEDLKKQISQLQQQLNNSSIAQNSNRELLQAVFADKTYWLTLQDDEKKQIFHALVSRVIVKNGAVSEIILKV